jgi:hypothetical protein
MKVIKASLNHQQQEWRDIDHVIRSNMSARMSQAWNDDGYEGIAQYAPTEFGMYAMYRDENDSVTFEFTDEQWTWFALKWL